MLRTVVEFLNKTSLSLLGPPGRVASITRPAPTLSLFFFTCTVYYRAWNNLIFHSYQQVSSSHYFLISNVLYLKSTNIVVSSCYEENNIQPYIKVHTATRWTIRHSLKLHWFADLMNVTEEVTIHRPNSTVFNQQLENMFKVWCEWGIRQRSKITCLETAGLGQNDTLTMIFSLTDRAYQICRNNRRTSCMQ